MRVESNLGGVNDSAGVKTFYHGITLIPLLLLFLFATGGPVSAADVNTEQIEKDHKLQIIRTQIKDLESSIEDAKKDVDGLLNQLQANELAAVAIAGKIQHSREQISEKNRTLTQLSKDKGAQEGLLNRQRQHLAQQVRAAYRTGRNNYLKLMLNQEEPERVGRMLAYFDYDARARSKRISSINVALAEISTLEQRMQTEKQALSQLQQQQQSKLAEFQAYRNSRKEITSKLQSHIDNQALHLQILQRDEQELAALVSKLKKQELTIQIFEDTPPFNSLRGKLEWPVAGNVTSRFGSLKKGDNLKWQGVIIAAKNGIEVKAITTGKVVFADWFRNMGLLMILDHGDGYMSLYGHNERLLKKAGDWVLAGDLIARVGDTGGQHQSGLYFEIRQNGNPVNPNLWCKR